MKQQEEELARNDAKHYVPTYSEKNEQESHVRLISIILHECSSGGIYVCGLHCQRRWIPG